nr:hypothetical protein CFP56_39459 [Quercus suber]
MLNLHKRRIVPSSVYSLCHVGEESFLHALWSCEDNCSMWGSCFASLPSEFSRVSSFRDLLELVFCSLLNSEVFAMTCWAIWNRRNKLQVGEVVWPLNKAGFYEVRKKNFARGSQAKEVRTDSVVRPVHSTPQAAIQVQPLDVSNREFLENQIHEIDRGLSCFDTNDGDVLTSAGLNVVLPFRQDMRSDSTPSTNPCDTKINCFSIPNTSIAVSSGVSDSGSLSVGGKVVLTRRRRIVRIFSGFVISNDSGGTSVKRISEVNALDGIVPSSVYSLCHVGEESVLHALWSCEDNCSMWGSCFASLPSEFSRVSSFRDLLELVFCSLLNSEVFAMTCWAIWNRRNKLQVGEVVWPLNKVAGIAHHHLQEFQQVCHCPSKKVRVRRPWWKPPDAGFVKANFDGAIFEDLMAAGGVLAPFFATDEPGDDELVVKYD